MKKYILLLDTETTGDITKPLVFDIAYAIIDINGNIQMKRNVLIKEIYTNYYLMQQSYYKFFDKYTILGNRHQIDIVTFKEFVKEFKFYIAQYNIATIMAYNVQFDINAINHTARYLHSYNVFSPFIFDYKCLWAAWNSSIALTPSYYTFCMQNGFVGKKTIRTNAETAIRFIMDNVNYIESHTAMDDVLDELKIYQFLKNKKCALSFKGTNTWKNVSEYWKRKGRIESCHI